MQIVIAGHYMNFERHRELLGPMLKIVCLGSAGGNRRVQKIAEDDEPTSVESRHEPSEPAPVSLVRPRWNRNPVPAKVAALAKMGVGDYHGAATWPNQGPFWMKHQRLAVYQ